MEGGRGGAEKWVSRGRVRGQAPAWRSGRARGRLPDPSSSTSGVWRSSACREDPPSRNRDRDAGGSSSQSNTEKVDEIGSSLVGTCPDMCPVKERIQRERLRDLAVFERLDGNPGRTTPNLAVKKFCRNIFSVDVQPSEVRPLPVLQETLRYLYKLLLPTNHPFEVIHDFVSDRTRSIRQDISMQNIINDQTINMYEEMAKFHVVSHQKLMGHTDKSNISSLIHLNMEQLVKVLMSLYDMYSDNKKPCMISKKQAEFYSLYVLLHLDCNNQKMKNVLSLWLRKLPLHILQSKEMHFARSVLRHFQMGNYVRFFVALAADASYLQLCILQPVVNEVRTRAVMYVNNSGYKPQPYPLMHLSKLLMIRESDLVSICNLCGLKTITDEAGTNFLPTKQVDFRPPSHEIFQQYGFTESERLQRWEVMLAQADSFINEEIQH